MPPDLGAHLQPQLGVEVGQRLVHQHQRRLQHDRAGDRDALLLPAGQLAGELARVLVELDEAQRLVHPPARLGLGHPRHLQSEADVGAHRHVREERVVLEDHAEAAPLRRHVSIRRSSSQIAPPVSGSRPARQFSAVDLPQPGRAEQRDELAAPDGQVEPVQGEGAPEAAAHVVEPQSCAETPASARSLVHLPAADRTVPLVERRDLLLAPAATSPWGCSAIQSSYSGRPNCWMTCCDSRRGHRQGRRR